MILLSWRSPFVARRVKRRVLAAFARVGPRAHAIHADGERFVRLGAERAERHRRTHEALDDRGPTARPRPAARPGPRARTRAGRAASRAARRSARSAAGSRPMRRAGRSARPLCSARIDRWLPGVALAFAAETHLAVVRQLARGRPTRTRARAARGRVARGRSKPSPPMRLGVPVKQRSTTASASPRHSKICPPR